MSSSSPTYPASTLAKLFHLTERRVQQLAKEGIIPKGAKGKYELVGSVRGYVKYLHDRALGRSDATYTDPTDIRIERKRLIKAQAERAEQENQKQRGELIALYQVTHLLNELTVLYAASIEALPGRLAQELVGLHDPADIKQRLFIACRDIRSGVANQLRGWAKTIEVTQDASESDRCTFAKNTG